MNLRRVTAVLFVLAVSTVGVASVAPVTTDSPDTLLATETAELHPETTYHTENDTVRHPWALDDNGVAEFTTSPAGEFFQNQCAKIANQKVQSLPGWKEGESVVGIGTDLDSVVVTYDESVESARNWTAERVPDRVVVAMDTPAGTYHCTIPVRLEPGAPLHPG